MSERVGTRAPRGRGCECFSRRARASWSLCSAHARDGDRRGGHRRHSWACAPRMREMGDVQSGNGETGSDLHVHGGTAGHRGAQPRNTFSAHERARGRSAVRQPPNSTPTTCRNRKPNWCTGAGSVGTRPGGKEGERASGAWRAAFFTPDWRHAEESSGPFFPSSPAAQKRPAKGASQKAQTAQAGRGRVSPLKIPLAGSSREPDTKLWKLAFSQSPACRVG